MPFRLKFFLIVACLWSGYSHAVATYDAHPGSAAIIEELVKDEGFDREALSNVFASAKRQESILKAIARPAEKTKAWFEYREIFLNKKREDQGVEFWEEHRATLDRAEKEYGVPANIIVAIIGVETYYGRVAGSYRVIDALSTLAFDYPKRSKFFTSELKHYLLLTREQGFDPTNMKGSYAGAMGYGQFMPSSYRSYAVDFDGDGVTDIWNNPVDAIGSVANYFKRHGWRSGAPVVYAADASDAVPLDVFVQGRSGLKPQRNLAQYAQDGVRSREALGSDVLDKEALDPNALATAMKFELESGYEYWLGLHNFYVITRYNHSAMYAMSVHQLSERLAQRLSANISEKTPEKKEK